LRGSRWRYRERRTRDKFQGLIFTERMGLEESGSLVRVVPVYGNNRLSLFIYEPSIERAYASSQVEISSSVC